MPDTFTPEQISQILEEFFKVVGTRQYIGARYVPIFGRKGEESIEWDNTAPYEPLTIVLYQGNSYTSRQFVPVGVEITNQEFWAITGNYNAQVEMYRRETAAVREIAEAAQNDIDTLLPKANYSAENTVTDYVDEIARNTALIIGNNFSLEHSISDFEDETNATLDGFDANNTVKNYIDAGDALLPKSDFSAENTVKKYIDNLVSSYADIEYGNVSFTGTLGNVTSVHYAIIPKQYKPKLRIANGTVNTVEHEIVAANNNHSIVLINAGIFDTSTKVTEGVVISDGEILKNSVTALDDRTTIIMTDDGKLHSVSSASTGEQIKASWNPVWAVTSFYSFIESGVFTQSQRTQNDFQPRSCIAQDAEGNYCVFSCAGRKQYDVGMSIFDMRDFLNSINFNAEFAYNLDGGASASLSVMGIRTNRLTDNNHRAVANFLSFELEDTSESIKQIFDGNLAIANMLIQLNTFMPQFYTSTLNQYVSDGGNVSNSIFNIDKSTADYKYDAVLTETFTQANALYRLLLKLPNAEQAIQALALNTQYEQMFAYNRYVLTRQPIEILAFGNHAVTAAGDTYQLENALQQCVSFIAIVEQSSKQQYVHMYNYALGIQLGNRNSISQWFTSPDGQQVSITMEIDYNANTVKLTRGGDTSGAGLNVRKIVGLEWW